MAAINRKLRWVAWGIGSLLSLVVLLIALLHTPPARKYALRQIVSIMDKQGVTFDSSGFDYNLFSATAELRNVVVRSPKAPDLPPVLKADRVQVDIGLRSLVFGGKFTVESGSIRNPAIHVVIDENGRSNLPELPEDPNKPKTETKITFLIDEFLIEGGDLRVEDRRQKVAAHLPVSRLTVDGNPVTGNHDILLTAGEGGTASYQGRSLPLRAVTADVLLKETSLEVRKLNVGLGESTVAVNGTLDNFDTPKFNVKGDTSLALAPLIQFAGVEQSASGTAEVSFTASGATDQVVATANVAGENLQIDRLRDVDIKAEADYDMAKSRARVSSLNIASPSGTIQGKADLALKPEAGQSTANISTRNLDLGTLTAAFQTPVRIASRATADIAARWPGMEYKQAAADATIRLSPTRSTPAKNVVPVTATVNAKTQGNRMVVGIQDLRALNARATGQVTLVNQSALGGAVKLEAPDLSGTIASAEAFLGRAQGTLVGTPVSGPLNVNAKLGGTVQNPTVGAQVQGESLTVGELNGIQLSATADYNPTRVVLQDANIAWRNQAIVASGTVGLKGAAPPINLVASSENISIQDVLAGLNRADTPVSGTARFNAEVRGTTKQPEVDATLGATELVAYNEQFGTLTAQAQLRGRTLTVPELRLDKPQEGGDGTLRASATYDLDAKTYTLDAKSDNLKLTSMTLPDGRPVRAELDVNAQSHGAAENPIADLNVRAKNVQLGTDNFGDVALTAHVENQQAQLQAAAPAFNLAANVNTSVKEPYPATFEVRADNVDLANLPIKIDQPVTGNVTATITGSGPLTAFLDNGQARIEVAALDLRYKDQPVRSDGPIVARYNNQTLTIESATLVAQESRVSLSGTLPLDQRGGEGAIQVAAKLDLASLMNYVPSEKPITAQGAATIDGSIRGNLKRIDPDIAVTLNNGYFLAAEQKAPVTNANLQAWIRNGALELQTATAQLGVANVNASGTVPFALLPADLPVEIPRRQGAAQFTADLQALDLSSLGTLPDNVSGIVSAHLEAEAARPELEALRARLTLPLLTVGMGSYVLTQQGTSEVVVENGVARINQFALTGPETKLQVSGTAGLTGTRPLDVRVDGNFDAAIATAFTDAVLTRGATELRASITGTAENPQAQGFLQMTGGQLSRRDPDVAVDQLNLRVDLAGTRATVSQLTGVINGGDLSGGGSIEYAKGTIANASLNVKARDVYMNVPEGLKTMSNVDLEVRNAGEEIVVGGRVQIAEGSYTEEKITRMLLAKATAPRPLDFTQQRSQLVENIRFDIHVVTQNPIVIDNSLAEAEVTANLRVIGSPYEPGLSGRVEILEGGELRFQERTYLVERGVVLFTGERSIEPTLDILATTTAGGYDITLQVSGETGKTETTLTSDPSLPEPDIMALLVTGKTMEEIRGNEFEVAQNQVLSYLTGRVGSQLGRTLSGATGLSTVRIEPNLIANEADPSARLTLGQDITRNLELIYSMDLVNSSDQIYVAEYDLTRRFTTRGVRQADGSFRGDFRHEIRFGGVREPRRGDRRVERIVGTVKIVGNSFFTDKQLADRLKAKPGKRYDYIKLRKNLEKIEEMYNKEGLLEAQVRLRREQAESGVVDLDLNVSPGPKVDLVYEGIAVPNDVQKDVRESWQSGVFDIQRADDAMRLIRDWLVKESYLQSKVEYKITESGERKRVSFDISSGPKFENVALEFDGAQGISAEKLRDVVKDQKLQRDVYVAPGRVTDMLTRLYQEFGYLDAELKAPKYELNAETRTGKVVFPVTEGPLYVIRKVEFDGNKAVDDSRLAAAAPVPVGEAYKPVLEEHALQRLREVYWGQGYNDVDLRMVLNRDKEAGRVDVKFNIVENQQSMVADIVVEGNRNTSENMIRTQLEVASGGVLDLQKLGNSRRNLYNTGAYSLVEIVREEVDAAAGEQTRARVAESTSEQKHVRLRVRVREIQPFEVRYGGFFDTERGPGAIVDVTNRNSLGSARSLGLRARYDTQLQELRLNFSQPLLKRFPVKTIVSPFIRRERNPATDESDPFSVDRIGISIQQEARPWQYYVWNYGYRLERTRTYDAGPNVLPELLVDPPVRIGSLTSTLTRETRDEIMDATRGSFMSHAIQFSPAMLGSQRPFAKYFGQYFRYIALEKEELELFTNEILRPRLVYAAGVRVGMARGIGGGLVPLSERFFAGGGNTIRGFEQNSLGPLGPSRELLGGEAMMVINNEIRFPLFSIFDGVGFSDIGNVWASAGDFSFGDIRKAAGVGLRVRTPWFLLRLDYGVKLDRRPDEGRGRLFFSIGQAF